MEIALMIPGISLTCQIKTIQNYMFSIYGKLLKQLYPNGPGWDGTYNGQPMPADDYWFYIS
jgi:gliding motility-associated-like protein